MKIYGFILVSLLLLSSCNSKQRQNEEEITVSELFGDEPHNAFEEQEDIKAFIVSQYEGTFNDFKLESFDSFSKQGNGYYAIIKFSYSDKGVKMYAVNNVKTDEEGYISEITYSHSIPFDELQEGVR